MGGGITKLSYIHHTWQELIYKTCSFNSLAIYISYTRVSYFDRWTLRGTKIYVFLGYPDSFYSVCYYKQLWISDSLNKKCWVSLCVCQFTWTLCTSTVKVDVSISWSSRPAEDFAGKLTVASRISCSGVSSLTCLSPQLVMAIAGQLTAEGCWTTWLTASTRSGRPDSVVIRRRPDGRHCVDRRRAGIVPFWLGTLPLRRADGCRHPKTFLNDFLKKSLVKP